MLLFIKRPALAFGVKSILPLRGLAQQTGNLSTHVHRRCTPPTTAHTGNQHGLPGRNAATQESREDHVPLEPVLLMHSNVNIF